MKNKKKYSVAFYSKHEVVSHGTTQLRCIQPAQYVQESGCQVSVQNIYQRVPRKKEITILHRALSDRYTTKFTEYAKSLGNPVIYDTDDFLFDPKVFEYLIDIEKRQDNKAESYKQQMIACHHVVVSTKFLAEKARDYCSNVTVIRNALSYSFIKKAERIVEERKKIRKECVTIAYLSGSNSHDQDFKVVEKVLISILRKYDNIRLLIVGPLNYSVELKKNYDKFEHRSFIPYDRFVDIYLEVDINLIPLDINNGFNDAKSELKYIEAAACGVPSVITPTKTYIDVIENGVTGMLAFNEKQWLEYINILIEQPQKRYEIGRNAMEHAYKAYHPVVRAKEWSCFFDEIYEKYKKKQENSIVCVKNMLSLKFDVFCRNTKKVLKKIL